MRTVRAAGTLDLTVHVADPASRPHTARGGGQTYRISGGVRSLGPGSTAGRTLCGRPMLLEELWCAHEPERRDPRCAVCLPPSSRRRRYAPRRTDPPIEGR